MKDLEFLANLITVMICILIFGAIVFIIGLNFTIQQSECIESGGKWVQGVISGSYSYFCIPK